MPFALWSAIVGPLPVSMAPSDSVPARLPLATSMLCPASPVVHGIAVTPAMAVHER